MDTSGALEFFKRHKVAVGVGAAAIVLLYLLESRGSSSAAPSSGIDAGTLQLAQLQASQNLQQAQLSAQTQTAQLGASVQQNQNNEAFQANEDQLAAELAGTAIQYNAQATAENTNASVYKDLIDTGAEENLAQLNLEGTLGSSAIALTNKGGRTQAGVNELAEVLGEGNVGSYNAGNSSTAIASSLEQASIFSSLTKGATGIVGSLF